jgi:hypothetical protein
MKILKLDKYGPIISDKAVGDEIFHLIQEAIVDNDFVYIDLSTIKSMATFNAKQIFGKLYLLLGPQIFFDKLRFEKTSDDLKLIIQIGIQSALEDQRKEKG